MKNSLPFLYDVFTKILFAIVILGVVTLCFVVDHDTNEVQSRIFCGMMGFALLLIHLKFQPGVVKNWFLLLPLQPERWYGWLLYPFQFIILSVVSILIAGFTRLFRESMFAIGPLLIAGGIFGYDTSALLPIIIFTTIGTVISVYLTKLGNELGMRKLAYNNIE